jgi:hypothetical protein
MKSYFIYSLVFIAITTVGRLSAQKGLSIIVKADPQFSFLENKEDNNNNYHHKTTYTVGFGAGIGYNYTRNLGIGMDLLYSMQGQRYIQNGFEYNQKLNYLKLPVYITYNTNPSRVVSFIGKIGPELSFLTGAQLEDKSGNKIADGSTKDKYGDENIGAFASSGMQLRVSKLMFVTTAVRIDYDFTNAENLTYSGSTSGRADTHNMTAGFELGLKYIIH